MGYLSGTMDARTKLDPKTDLRAGSTASAPRTCQPTGRLWMRCSSSQR